jgi:hypothetical protein
MPIIPVLTPEGDYSPPRMATPDINSLQGSYNARMGAAISAGGDALTDIASKKADIAGQIEAQQGRVRYAMAVEQIKKDVLDAPPQKRQGASADFGIPEDANNVPKDGDLGFVPKSETMLKDYETRLSKLDLTFTKGMSSIGQRYFVGPQSRIQAAAGKVMIDAKAAQWEGEQVAGLTRTVSSVHQDMYAIPAAGPSNVTTDDQGNSQIVGGVPSYDPTQNASFQAHLGLINDTFDHALALHMRPEVVEKMRAREVSKLYLDTAEKEMHADPENWSASTKAGTNGYVQHMDATHADRLESKADAAITKTQAQTEKQRKIAADGVMQELAAASQDHNTGLMREKLRDPVNRRLLTGEEQNTWYSRVLEMESGKIFSGNPGVEAEARIRAGDRNAGSSTISWLNTQYQNEVQRPGTGISYQVYQDLTGRVNQHTEQRETRGDRFANEEYHREREAGLALLKPVPDSAIPMLKQDEQRALQANAADFSDEFARRAPVGSSPGTAAKVRAEMMPRYLTRVGGQLQAHVDTAQAALPGRIKVNEATGELDGASLQEAKVAAWALSGVHSVEEAHAAERHNAVKPETKARLQAIETIENFSRYIADNKRALRENK